MGLQTTVAADRGRQDQAVIRLGRFAAAGLVLTVLAGMQYVAMLVGLLAAAAAWRGLTGRRRPHARTRHA